MRHHLEKRSRKDAGVQEPIDRRSRVSEGEEPGIVVAHGIFLGFVQDMVVGPHHVTADEPVVFGGTNRGPSPYAFFLMAPG